jgi:hypothetical protein
MKARMQLSFFGSSFLMRANDLAVVKYISQPLAVVDL